MKLLIFILINCVLLVKCNNIIWWSCEAKCRNSGNLTLYKINNRYFLLNNKIKAQLVTINTSPIVPNGCGSYGFNIDFDKYGNIKGFNECCNQHDTCYRTCNNTKVSCDKSFYSCLKTSCLDNDKYLGKILSSLFCSNKTLIN